MIVLGIETSCDETAAAIVKFSRGRADILASIVSSQINIHRPFGGVVPEVAARQHAEKIIPVIDQCLTQAKIKPKNINLIAVTAGPGLITSLIVGVQAARTLSMVWQKPVLAVNHMYAHVAANFLGPPVKFPAVCLIVSGGHTELIWLKNKRQFKKIGQTLDDASGEAFDKVAKLLNLGYPGGPIISRQAEIFAGQNQSSRLSFPRPMINSSDFNFSFSGLKTAVLYAVKKMRPAERKKRTPEICFAFQEAVIEVLTLKTIRAAKKYQAKTVILAGGVAANKKLRQTLAAAAAKAGFEFLVPDFSLCTDNAAMIALAGGHLFSRNSAKKNSWRKIKADSNWELT